LNPEVRKLRAQDVAWLADLHNAAFADYPVPAVLDASSLGFYLTETDVDPALSRYALRLAAATRDLAAAGFDEQAPPATAAAPTPSHGCPDLAATA